METLMLDSRCFPIDFIAWERAIAHLERGKERQHVRVVSEYADHVVRSVSRTIAVPAVLQLVPGFQRDGRFTDRVQRRTRQVRFSRRNILARDGGACQYCGQPVSRGLTFDHVIPRAQGGLTTWENIVAACMPCNQRKGGRTPAQAGMKLLSVPKKPAHSGHFLGFFEEGMPEEWRPWLPARPSRDVRATRLYWNGTLRR